MSPKSKLGSQSHGPSGPKTKKPGSRINNVVKGVGSNRNTDLVTQKRPVFGAARPGIVYRAEILDVKRKVTPNQVRAALGSRGLGSKILAVGLLRRGPQIEVVMTERLAEANLLLTIKGARVMLQEEGLVKVWIHATTLLITVTDIRNICGTLAPGVILGTVHQPNATIPTFICSLSKMLLVVLSKCLDQKTD
jgi:hypothetical protein